MIRSSSPVHLGLWHNVPGLRPCDLEIIVHKSPPLVPTIILAALLFASATAPASAQTSTPDKLQALRIESPIKLDGILDEEAWAKAPHISNFTQRELVENAPVTERTEVAVVFTAKEMYIGVWCFDSQPDRIIAQRMKWDFDTSSDDNFQIVIDTYGDRRNAYFIAVNPNASQADLLPGCTDPFSGNGTTTTPRSFSISASPGSPNPGPTSISSSTSSATPWTLGDGG